MDGWMDESCYHGKAAHGWIKVVVVSALLWVLRTSCFHTLTFTLTFTVALTWNLDHRVTRPASNFLLISAQLTPALKQCHSLVVESQMILSNTVVLGRNQWSSLSNSPGNSQVPIDFANKLLDICNSSQRLVWRCCILLSAKVIWYLLLQRIALMRITWNQINHLHFILTLGLGQSLSQGRQAQPLSSPSLAGSLSLLFNPSAHFFSHLSHWNHSNFSESSSYPQVLNFSFFSFCSSLLEIL